MVRRTACAPARCPAIRGSPRARAQRPFPSMMMATCRGTPCGAAASRSAAARSAGAPAITATPSNLTYVAFLLGKRVVHALDVLIGQLLHLLGPVAPVILADLVLLLVRLDLVHAVPPHTANRHPRALRIAPGRLRELAPP